MKSPEQQPSVVFDLSGGRLCLDFANTLSGKRLTQPTERLNSYADLVSWSRQAGTVSGERASRLLEQSARYPKKGARVLERARALREAIYRVWVAKVRKEQVAKAEVALLNSALAEALCHQRLVSEGDGFTLTWTDDDALESVLWPVAKSAADVLTSEEAQLVRQCEAYSAEECAWLFIDESRNRSRRWCSMTGCGNRAKARRHYHRTREDRDPPSRR